MSPLLAAFRIVVDTAAYRLEKREMGNLVTSMTLAVALGLEPQDLGVRLIFGVLLNLWAYLVNDLIDVAIDLRAPGRDKARVRFLSEHAGAGWGAVVVLSTALAAIGRAHSTGLFVSFVATAVVIVAYTRVLKHVPFADLLAMTAWGASMGLVGTPLDSRDGLRFVALLAVLCTVTEAVQVLRDAESDRAAGVRTVAVVAGERTTALLARGLCVFAGLYASACLHRFVGLAFALAALVPLSAARAARSWDAFRAIFGAGWLALLFAYHRAGRLDGWLP